MKLILLLLLSCIIAAGCASSEDNGSKRKQQFENLVELKQPPEQENTQDSNVYVDSVQLVEYNNRPALLVSGSFPDGCTNLSEASHSINNGRLELTLSAWRDPDMMCTQALTPFSYLYEKLPEEAETQQSAVLVNGTTYEIK